MAGARTTWTDAILTRGSGARFFAIPDRRILFVSVAKNACTTLKWMMAELAGEDLGRFVLARSPALEIDEAIHGRRLWQHVPPLAEIDGDVRARMHPDNGWFIFAVVRDPRERLFSAWQHKFLLQNPRFADWRAEPWFPRIPRHAGEVAEDFARFVAALQADGRHPMRRDSHFKTQTGLLRADVIPYSRIFEIGEIETLRLDVQRHVATTGWSQPIALRRSNATSLRANAQAFTGPVRGWAEDLYAKDLDSLAERFGWNFARLVTRPAWSERSVNEVRTVATLGWQLGDLRADLLRHEAEARRAGRQAARAVSRRRSQRLAVALTQLRREGFAGGAFSSRRRPTGAAPRA